jgi:hypothetical protein
LPPASAGFLFGLLFDPEDGSHMFLLNVRFSPNYMVLQPQKISVDKITYFLNVHKDEKQLKNTNETR